MELDDVTDELYGLRPQEFTAAREERAQRARADGRRELAERIRALRRPTNAAWASNLLVREKGEQVPPLLRLGEELRGAHRDLAGEELRRLSHRQHQLVNAMSKEAERLAAQAGVPLGAQAQQEVAQTLHAVLTDPEAAQEWAAGRLSKPLAVPAGFDAAAREVAAAPASSSRSGGARARTQRKQPQKAEPGGRPEQAAGRGRAEPSRKETRKPSGKTGRESRAPRKTTGKAVRKTAGKTTGKTARKTAGEAAGQAHRRRKEADAASEETAAARAAREAAEERVGLLRGEIREAEETRKESRKREREAERAEREARRRAEEAEEAEERARREAGTARSGR